MSMVPERRVSIFSDRRRNRRGGRRATDKEWTSLPSFVACPACPTGTAGRLTFTTKDTTCTVTYFCRDCGHKFDRADEG